MLIPERHYIRPLKSFSRFKYSETLKNRAIFTILKKTMDFFEVTVGFRLGEKGAVFS